MTRLTPEEVAEIGADVLARWRHEGPYSDAFEFCAWCGETLPREGFVQRSGGTFCGIEHCEEAARQDAAAGYLEDTWMYLGEAS